MGFPTLGDRPYPWHVPRPLDFFCTGNENPSYHSPSPSKVRHVTPQRYRLWSASLPVCGPLRGTKSLTVTSRMDSSSTSVPLPSYVPRSFPRPGPQTPFTLNRIIISPNNKLVKLEGLWVFLPGSDSNTPFDLSFSPVIPRVLPNSSHPARI